MYWRLLNISYKDQVTNEEVRRKIQAAIGKYDELAPDPGQEMEAKMVWPHFKVFWFRNKLKEPVYGELNAKYTDFMAPGIILSITFFQATGMTTLAFVMDKKTGMLDRVLASGMITFEVMLAHMFTQMLIVVVQDALLLVFTLIVFGVACKGPLIWVILLVLIQGFCGMSLGVLYSAFCNNENSAIQLSLGSFFPLLLLSGILWPIEAIPTWLRYISYCSPLTFAVEAVRCILARGLDIAFYAVWRGYLTSLGWIGVLMLVGGIVLRVKE